MITHPHLREALKSIDRFLPLITPHYFKEAVDILNRLMWQFEKKKDLTNSDFDFEALHSHCPLTFIHSMNVALFSIIIAHQMGFRGEFIREVAVGGLFHDWGKILVPQPILQKPSSLTVSEFELIKKHPINGEKMLRRTQVSEDILKTIRQHHERWLGQGYPDSLAENQIHLQAQIVAVADVFEALTADRPYRKGLHPYHALEMIFSGAGIEFAPDVVRAFRGSLFLYPDHLKARLNTSEIGIVIAVPMKLITRPVVKILYDEKGRPIQGEKIIDLMEKFSYSISLVHDANVRKYSNRDTVIVS